MKAPTGWLQLEGKVIPDCHQDLSRQWKMTEKKKKRQKSKRHLLTELQVWFLNAKYVKEISDLSAWGDGRGSRARKTWMSYLGYLSIEVAYHRGKSKENVLEQLRIITDPNVWTVYRGRGFVLKIFAWIFYPAPRVIRCVI